MSEEVDKIKDLKRKVHDFKNLKLVTQLELFRLKIERDKKKYNKLLVRLQNIASKYREDKDVSELSHLANSIFLEEQEHRNISLKIREMEIDELKGILSE